MSIPPRKIVIPDGLKTLLEELNRAVLRYNPENVIHFTSLYFDELLQFRSENTGLDLDNLIKEFNFTKKSNKASCVEDKDPLPQDTMDFVTVLPSTPQPPTTPDPRTGTADTPSSVGSEQRSPEGVLSATTITLCPGLFSPEAAQGVSVFWRARDQVRDQAGSGGSPPSDGIACHQGHSALFERISLQDVTSKVETVLIHTSRVPSESLIIVQTQEIPEMIVFQAKPTLAEDGAQNTRPSLDNAVGAMPDGPEVGPGLPATLTHTGETDVAAPVLGGELSTCPYIDHSCFCSPLRQLDHSDPHGRPPAPANVPALGLQRLGVPVYEDCSRRRCCCNGHCWQHDRLQSCASHGGYLDVCPAAEPACTGGTLAPFLSMPTYSWDLACCHGCYMSANVSRYCQPQHPLLACYHNCQHKCCSHNGLRELHPCGCTQACHQGVPETSQRCSE